MPSTDPSDVQSLGFEQALDELVEVVRRLETGGTTLEEALALWERGEALAARCQTWLDGARDVLEAARRTTGGAGGAGGADREGPSAGAS